MSSLSDTSFDSGLPSELPRDLFAKLESYWNKTITYNFPKINVYDKEIIRREEEEYYLYLPHFHDYIIYQDEYNIDVRKGKLKLVLETDGEWVHQTENRPKYNFGVINLSDEDAKNCEHKQSELIYFERFILITLSELYDDYEDVLRRYNNPDIMLKLGKDDNKCINCNWYLLKTDMRDINNTKSLYCKKCNKKERDLDTRIRNYNAYLLVLARRYKRNFTDLVKFLQEPLPSEFVTIRPDNSKMISKLNLNFL